MMKKIIIIAVIAIVAAVGIWLLVPRHDKLEQTVRCYDIYAVSGYSEADDGALEGKADYVDIECDFEVTYSIVVKPSIKGKVKIDGIEYNLNSQNVSIDKNWIPATVSAEDQTFIYLSPDRKNIMLFDTKRKEKSVYWVGADNSLGELKKAAEAFDLEYQII